MFATPACPTSYYRYRRSLLKRRASVSICRHGGNGAAGLRRRKICPSACFSSETMADEDSRESDYGPNIVVFTVDEILWIGLRLVKFTKRRIREAKREINIDKFRGFFGLHPSNLGRSSTHVYSGSSSPA